MPARAHQWTRREMNKLVRVISKYAAAHPPLEAIRTMVMHSADELNTAWADYRRARARRSAGLERPLASFIERWRPVAILLIPGAGEALGDLPPRGGLGLLGYAERILTLVRAEPGEEKLAITLATELAEARGSVVDGFSDAEDAANVTLSDAALRAHIVLLHSLDALRACVGEDSEIFEPFSIDLPWDQDVLRARPWEASVRGHVGL